MKSQDNAVLNANGLGQRMFEGRLCATEGGITRRFFDGKEKGTVRQKRDVIQCDKRLCHKDRRSTVSHGCISGDGSASVCPSILDATFVKTVDNARGIDFETRLISHDDFFHRGFQASEECIALPHPPEAAKMLVPFVNRNDVCPFGIFDSVSRVASMQPRI
jgi:hypothetical protein